MTEEQEMVVVLLVGSLVLKVQKKGVVYSVWSLGLRKWCYWHPG